ncbi:signal recognition particle-docking protein FtsY [Aliidiomarina iranensis]|uniref:Signal recognition particle receptor FtsY n=1 Tax=Aliidiomarina iranensis TaxID=1434071 RepID=A0A432W2A1_9GAMM|nr:signal recognition particle-docking protein FtsY [Aliidiomarina iranensis]RUO23351.1 signal recognition particle-docking protein FtsY [Aliidiomarina iranensis]
MAKKPSIFSTLFGRKKAEETKEERNEQEQNEALEKRPETSGSDSEIAAEDAPKESDEKPTATNEEVVEANINADSATPEAKVAPQESEHDSPLMEREGTDLPSAVDDAASMHSKSVPPASATQERPQRMSWWQRLRQGLQKTSSSLGSGLANLFVGKEIDEELFEDLETQLLMADVGVDTTAKIIDQLTEHASRKELKDAELLYAKLKDDMAEILAPVSEPLMINNTDGPFVILMVGVNGVGKTTTIGKLARQFQSEGKSVMLAAGDTFRAAAVEQLQVWGERNEIPVIAQHTGADSASVIFDAVQAAKARGVDVLIADTAGRLQNKANLMEELKKIVRVMRKLDAAMPHEVLLTLDAGTGQNAISQAKLFNEAVGVSGLVMTKLDGTAKGGVIFALANQFKIPIRYIGVGESLEDLRPFVASEFVDALFANNASQNNAS